MRCECGHKRKWHEERPDGGFLIHKGPCAKCGCRSFVLATGDVRIDHDWKVEFRSSSGLVRVPATSIRLTVRGTMLKVEASFWASGTLTATEMVIRMGDTVITSEFAYPATVVDGVLTGIQEIDIGGIMPGRGSRRMTITKEAYPRS